MFGGLCAFTCDACWWMLLVMFSLLGFDNVGWVVCALVLIWGVLLYTPSVIFVWCRY